MVSGCNLCAKFSVKTIITNIYFKHNAPNEVRVYFCIKYLLLRFVILFHYTIVMKISLINMLLLRFYVIREISNFSVQKR